MPPAQSSRRRWVFSGLIVTFAVAVGSAGRQPSAMQPVDAATFAAAVQQGHADQYKGRTVAGTGADFHGGSPSLALTVGSAAAGDRKPITTWDEFLAAQRARTTLVVALNVAGFQRTTWPKRGVPPTEYTFSGVFNGRMQTIARMGVPADPDDSGPCPDQPRTGVGSRPMSYHCIPILENATIEKR